MDGPHTRKRKSGGLKSARRAIKCQVDSVEVLLRLVRPNRVVQVFPPGIFQAVATVNFVQFLKVDPLFFNRNVSLVKLTVGLLLKSVDFQTGEVS